MHDTHDVRKSKALETLTKDKRLHDLEMLIDEMERRLQVVESEINYIKERNNIYP